MRSVNGGSGVARGFGIDRAKTLFDGEAIVLHALGFTVDAVAQRALALIG